jgi:hypothetical protein
MMKKIMILIAVAGLQACGPAKTTTMNTSDDTSNRGSANSGTPGTATSTAGSWQPLFDGKTTAGWHTYGKQTIGKAWKVEDGSLRLDASSKKDWQTAEGGDIVTDREFENFHLKLDWRIAPNGNSGVIFFVKEDPAKYEHSWHTGMEMQVLDNAGHADAKIIKHRAGDLYDLISVSKETVKPAGEWNTAEIIANRGTLRLILNGTEGVNTTLWNDTWRTMVAGSKFKGMNDFGTFKKGRIALQDHGDNVWYRNIMIREL